MHRFERHRTPFTPMQVHRSLRHLHRTIEITVQRAKTALFAWSIRRNTSKPRFYSLILLALATFSACKLCKIGS